MGQGKWTKRNQELSLAGIKYWRADWLTAIHYVAGDGVHSLATGSAYICILEHNSDATTQPGIGTDWKTYWNILVSGSNTVIDVTQTAHGFSLGDYVRSSGINGEYALAQADSEAHAQGIGLVTAVDDSDAFTLTQSGYIADSSVVPNQPAGTVMYLDPAVAGGLTIVKPIIPNQYVKPVAIIITPGESMWLLSDSPILAQVISGNGGGGSTVFQFEFDTTVSGAPAAGHVTYDDADPTLVTVVAVNNTDGDGNNIVGLLSTMLPGDTLLLTSVGSPGNFATYQIVSTTNAGSETDFVVSFISSNSTFADDEPITVTLTHAGSGGGGGSGGSRFIDQTPDNGTYGLLVGAVDGVNTTFTVSQGLYASGTLVVYLNGILQLQGASNEWEETTPGSGIFDFITAPFTDDIITAEYQTSGTTPTPESSSLFEEFIGGTTAISVFVGNYLWKTISGNAVLDQNTGEEDHPGIILISGFSANGDGAVLGGHTNSMFYDNVTVMETEVQVNNLNSDYFFGMFTGGMGSNFAGNQDRIGITAGVDIGGDWVGVTADTSAKTLSGATAPLVSGAWVKLKITFDGTTVEFFVDDVSLGTVTATLPVGACGVGLQCKHNTQDASVKMDWFSLNIS